MFLPSARLESANSQLNLHQNNGVSARQALDDAEKELEICDEEKTECDDSKRLLDTQL